MSTETTSGEETQPQDVSSNDTTDIAFSVDNIIGDILAAEQSPAPEEAAAEPVEAQPVDSAEKEATPAEQKELLSPLLAEKSRREREARAEIETLKGSREQELTDAKAAVVAELLQNPQAFAQKHGITPDAAEDLALNFYALGLGDDAPDDLKAQVGVSELDRFKAEQKREMAALRAEMAQKAEIDRNQEVLNQYTGLLADVPTDYPYLAVEASNDSQEALRTMAQVADAIYQRDNVYPSAIAVAQLIESEISAQVARYAAVGTQPDVKLTQTEPVEKETINTLSTEHSGRTAKRAPQGEDELFSDALALFETMTAPKE